MTKDGIPLDEWSGAKATKELHAALAKFHDESSRQTTAMIRLTWVIAALTLMMFVGLIAQIVLTIRFGHA